MPRKKIGFIMPGAYVPPELRRRAKVQSARLGVSLSDYVAETLARRVDDDELMAQIEQGGNSTQKGG